MSHIQNFWNDKRTSNSNSVSKCCGCSACASKCPKSAISMRYDQEGFLYPVVESKRCVECGVCLNVCPINDKENLLKPYKKTYAGYSLNNKEDLFAFASSKYVQSEKNDIYKQVETRLKQGQYVLFIGCPCDVYAMKKYLGKVYGTFLSCELVCMGVSSYKIAEAYKNYAEKKYKSKLRRINARSKRKGWFVPHLEEEYENGQIMCNTLYGTFLGYGMQVYNRPSCFSCKFRGENGVGDIRVGDFWGIKETDSYWNPKGVSCIFIRTENGEKALKLLDKSEFAMFETDYDTATLSNMSAHSNKSDKYVKKREKFAKVFMRKGLLAACVSTGTISFWTKHIIPDRYHNTIKKIYHIFKDKR